MIEQLQKALTEDQELFEAYQANIAVCVSDAVHWKKKELGKSKLNKTEMHEAFNDGAKHFLNLLIKQ